MHYASLLHIPDVYPSLCIIKAPTVWLRLWNNIAFLALICKKLDILVLIWYNKYSERSWLGDWDNSKSSRNSAYHPSNSQNTNREHAEEVNPNRNGERKLSKVGYPSTAIISYHLKKVKKILNCLYFFTLIILLIVQMKSFIKTIKED